MKARSRQGTTMRREVVERGEMGQLPSWKIAGREDQRELLKRYELLITSIQKPVTDDEARVLVNILGPNDCFGLEWSLVALVESAPDWPLWDCLENTSNEWIQMLRHRVENAERK